MGRGSSRELAGAIVECLRDNGKKSIQDIADDIGADRQAVTKYLEELKSSGLVKEEKEGRSRTFFISQYEDRDTYFQLPLDPQAEAILETVFGRISREYRQEEGEDPSKLGAQKMAFEVVTALDLDVPYGRYKYGGITAMNFTPGEEYPEHEGIVPEDELDRAVEEAVEKYRDGGFGGRKRTQYEGSGFGLYRAKEDIGTSLATGGNRDALQDRLRKFLANLPQMDEEADEIVIDFAALAPEYLGDDESRAKAMEAFKAVWDMVALYRFHRDLEEYDGYTAKFLDDRFSSKEAARKDDAVDAVSELVESSTRTYEIGGFEDLKGAANEND